MEAQVVTPDCQYVTRCWETRSQACLASIGPSFWPLLGDRGLLRLAANEVPGYRYTPRLEVRCGGRG